MIEMTLENIALWTHIGVPKQERAKEQRILTTVTLGIEETKVGTTDDLAGTVDYKTVYRAVKTLARAGHTTLERLAEEIAITILKDFRVSTVSVTLRKFILPGTKEVSVTITKP